MAEWQYVWLIRLKSPWVVTENQSMEHCISDAMRPLPMWSTSLPKEFVRLCSRATWCQAFLCIPPPRPRRGFQHLRNGADFQPSQTFCGVMARKPGYRRRSPSCLIHPHTQQKVVILIAICPKRNSPTRASVDIQSSIRLNGTELHNTSPRNKSAVTPADPNFHEHSEATCRRLT
jgi:hypothetical protein